MSCLVIGGLARYWRWRGLLIRYAVCEPLTPAEDAPAPLLCVHGFGASADQWDDLMLELRGRGQQVRACARELLGPRNNRLDFRKTHLKFEGEYSTVFVPKRGILHIVRETSVE